MLSGFGRIITCAPRGNLGKITRNTSRTRRLSRFLATARLSTARETTTVAIEDSCRKESHAVKNLPSILRPPLNTALISRAVCSRYLRASIPIRKRVSCPCAYVLRESLALLAYANAEESRGFGCVFFFLADK